MPTIAARTRTLIRTALLAFLLCPGGLRASFEIPDYDLRAYALDTPERASEQCDSGVANHTLVLTQLHNKFFVYAFDTGSDPRRRLWKSPALVMDLDEPGQFDPERGGLRPGESVLYEPGDDLAVVTYGAPQRVMVVKHTDTGCRVVYLAERDGRLQVRSASPLRPDETAWLQRLLSSRKLSWLPFLAKGRGPASWVFRALPAANGNRELARVHALGQAVAKPAKPAKRVAELDRLLRAFDVRDLGPDPAGLARLEDVGRWLGAAGRPASAEYVLDAILRRAPELTPALLDRADLNFSQAQAGAGDGLRRAALEDYRHYLRTLLAAGLPIPARVAARLRDRLGVAELTERSCHARFEIFRQLAPAARPRLAELLASGLADPNEIDAHGNVPITLAFQAGDLDLLHFLLEHGANPGGLPERNPLLALVATAIARRAPDTAPDFTLMDELLARGADPDPVYSTWDGPGSLLLRVLEDYPGDQPLVAHLLQHGARAAYATPKGRTPVWEVVDRHQAKAAPDVLKALLAAGADPNVVAFHATNPGTTPLERELIHLGRTDAGGVPDLSWLRLLLEAGADPTLGHAAPPPEPLVHQALNSNLERAVASGCYAALDLLLAHTLVPAGALSAEPMIGVGEQLRHIQNHLGDRDGVLWAARIPELRRIQARLLALGADPNLGRQPGHDGGYDNWDDHGSGAGSMAFFPLLTVSDLEGLLDRGLDPTLRDRNGHLPVIQQLAPGGDPALARVLLARAEAYWRDPQVAGWVASDLMGYLVSMGAGKGFVPDTALPQAVWALLKTLEQHPCDLSRAYARGPGSDHRSGQVLAQELGLNFRETP